MIAPIVAQKGRIGEERRAAFTRGALDAFINSVYRTLKCQRTGNALCAHIEAVEAVRHGLAVIFALEGRLRPYPAYLQHELRHYPLETFPMSGEQVLFGITAIVERDDSEVLQRLLRVVLERARDAGHGDVIDAWGNDVLWMLDERREAGGGRKGAGGNEAPREVWVAVRPVALSAFVTRSLTGDSRCSIEGPSESGSSTG